MQLISGILLFLDIFDKDEKKEGSSSEEEGNFSTLRELLIRPSHKPNGSRAASPVSSKSMEPKKKPAQPTKPADLDDVISSVIEDSVPQKVVETPSTVEPKYELKHFVRRYNWQGKGRLQLPIRIMTLTESKTLYHDTPHSWLCDGKLLRLSDPLCKENYKIFQVRLFLIYIFVEGNHRIYVKMLKKQVLEIFEI